MCVPLSKTVPGAAVSRMRCPAAQPNEVESEALTKTMFPSLYFVGSALQFAQLQQVVGSRLGAGDLLKIPSPAKTEGPRHLLASEGYGRRAIEAHQYVPIGSMSRHRT